VIGPVDRPALTIGVRLAVTILALLVVIGGIWAVTR
jgi:hypothetical protein